MKPLFFTFLFLILLSGCTFGRPSGAQGSAKFSIPFDFNYPDEEYIVEDDISEEIIQLEAEMILEKKLQKIKESD